MIIFFIIFVLYILVKIICEIGNSIHVYLYVPLINYNMLGYGLVKWIIKEGYIRDHHGISFDAILVIVIMIDYC